MYLDDFLIFRRTLVTRQFLVSLTSIVYFFLLSFLFLPFFWISENRLNGFENGKTQLFNSGGVVKGAYFQKKWSIPLKYLFFSFVQWKGPMDIKCSSWTPIKNLYLTKQFCTLTLRCFSNYFEKKSYRFRKTWGWTNSFSCLGELSL